MTDIRSHLLQLNETRMRVFNEAKSMLDDVERRGRDMDAEERQKWQRLNSRIDELDAEVRQLDERDRRENESAALREANHRIFGPPVAHREATEASQLRALLNGDIRSIELPMAPVITERRMLRDGASPDEIRALAWDTGSVASAVPTSMARTLYQYLEASTAMFKAPTTKVTTTGGEPLQFPRVAAHAIATQVAGQGTTLAGTDPTFSRLELGAFKYGQLVRVASEVVQDTSVDIIDFVLRDMGRALGRLIDQDLVTGSGSGKPNGVITALAGAGAGSVTTGGSLINPTYEHLVDLQYAVNDEYRAAPSAGWMMNDATAAVLRKLRDGAGGTTGAVMWEPSLTHGISGGQPDRLLGHSVWTDPNIASLASNSRSIVYGDWSAFYIRQAGSVMLERDDSRYFDSDEVALRGKIRIDGDLLDLGALKSLVRNV